MEKRSGSVAMNARVKVKKQNEGKAVFFASTGKISKELSVFYNPVMKLNRDISILLLNSINKSRLQISDILAGSGIRSVRFVKELKKGKIKSICANDNNKKAVKIIKKNIRLNKANKIKVCNQDANEFLLKSSGFDYIDVDPFGSPNPFLNSAIVRLSRNGILAVTATDTSALAGSHELACKRKYWAKPLKNELMHEAGIRILIRKIQLIGAQFEKALIPIFTHASDHYYRVYFKCKKSKQEIDKLQRQHLYLLYCGKCLNTKTSHYNLGYCCKKEMIWAGMLWAGRLWDSKLTKKMFKNIGKRNKDLIKLLALIERESRITAVGFIDIHKVSKAYKKPLPKQGIILKKIKLKGFKAEKTHFNNTAIRTDMPIKKLISLF
ncbi:tRNA (guanine(10)-N(2))-dimethyltransferase [Candidatus Woesearchaeota archaeon]|nr:tRNA (guanine(10)-N(2))-dimethyltransferase [Candidatus Woesearchaeota archaeon]